MAWFSDLAGKAENLLNNLDEQTGAALRNNLTKRRTERQHTSSTEGRVTSPRRRKCATKASGSPRRALLNSRQLFDKDNKNETKSATWKVASSKPYTLDNCPETVVGDMIHNHYCGFRQRKLSLPSKKELMHKAYTFSVSNIEAENSLLKNELEVLHKEISQLLHRLKRTEDGNTVVSDQALLKASEKLEAAEKNNRKENLDKMSLSTQFEELKQKVHELTVTEMEKQKKLCREMELEIDMLKKRNQELEEMVRDLNKDATQYESQQIKAEKDLKHAQTVISELESNLEKTTAECRRLETDWETYKLRVKSMLHAKDKEIKHMQEGLNLTEDTKLLMDKMEALKEQREKLSEKLTKVRNDSSNQRRQVEELEARHAAAERVVSALRDALKEERTAKTRAEAHVTALAKELKTFQTETNQTIVSLHAALRDKDSEICRLKENAVNSTDTSALNVGDYNNQASIDGDKIRYLTQTLVQRQGKIDSLLADNNMLKIQLEKMESKFKAELSALRTQPQSKHSVVNLPNCSRRAPHAGSFMQGLALRLGPMFRYPVFRLFVLFYMLGLHFWVITVLLTSSPDIFSKSGLWKENLDKPQSFQT